MKISDLDTQITIEEPWQYSDGGGGYTVDWQPIATDAVVYARIRQTGAQEAQAAGKLEFTNTYAITLRRRDDMRPDMRLRDEDTVYTITAIIDTDPSKTWMIVKAARKVL